MILGTQNTRLRANKKISVTGPKKSEVISSLFLTLSFSLPSSLMVLAWQLSSFRLLHLVMASKLPSLGFYILKASPSKERSLEPLEFKGVPWMTHLSSHVQPEISHPGRAMGSYDWLYMVIGRDTTAHMIVKFLQNYMTEAGETAPSIATGGWSRPWKSLWWPTNSTTFSLRGIIRGNEIDSLHSISDDLITGLLLQGILGEVLHAKLVPSCSHTPVTSSLPHMPALSFPVLLCKWWPQWIPKPSPSSRAQNAPSLASNVAGENATHVSGDPVYTEPSAFLSFLQGWSYKLFSWSCPG